MSLRFTHLVLVGFVLISSAAFSAFKMEGYMVNVHPLDDGWIRRKFTLELDTDTKSGSWTGEAKAGGKWKIVDAEKAIALKGTQNGDEYFFSGKLDNKTKDPICLFFDVKAKSVRFSYNENEMLILPTEQHFRKTVVFQGTISNPQGPRAEEYQFSLFASLAQDPEKFFYHHVKTDVKGRLKVDTHFYSSSEAFSSLFPASLSLRAQKASGEFMLEGASLEADAKGEMKVVNKKEVELLVGFESLDKIYVRGKAMKITAERLNPWGER